MKPGQVLINPDGVAHPFQMDAYVVEAQFWICIKGDSGNNGLSIMTKQLFRYDSAFKDIFDDPRSLPTEPTLIEAIRHVPGINYHTTLKMEGYLSAATFIGTSVNTQVPRGVNAPYTGS